MNDKNTVIGLDRNSEARLSNIEQKPDRFSKEYKNVFHTSRLSSFFTRPPSKTIRLADKIGYKRFRKQEYFPSGTKLREGQKDAEMIYLDRDDVQDSARRPSKFSKKEWLAINGMPVASLLLQLMYFGVAYLIHNHICEIYSWLHGLCTEKSCPRMIAHEKYEFLWCDGKTVLSPISIPALEYVTQLMIWIEYQFHDFNVFPNYDGAHFSSSIFLPTVITVFKRLVRPYAHVLCHHLDDLEMANFKINFLNGLLYFIEFLKENHVVDVKYMRPVTINLEWNNFVNSLKH